MKTIITLCSILLSISVFGQKTVNNKVIYDDPLKENLLVAVDFFDVDLWMGNEDKRIEAGAGIGLSVQANYSNLLDRMSVDFYYRRNFKGAPRLGASFLETGITWDLARSTKTHFEDIKFGSAGANKVYMMQDVKMTAAHKFRVRAGLTLSSTGIETPIKLGFVNSDVKVQSTGVYAGLEYATNTNYKSLANGYKTRRVNNNFRVFADVITTPLTSYGDTLYASGYSNAANTFLTDQYKDQLDSLGAITQFGYRLGVKYVLSTPGGFNWMFESHIGLKPPYTGFYMYLGMGVAFNIGTNFQSNSARNEEE